MSENTTPETPVTTTTTFGLGQVGNPTPPAAKWAFRIFFYVASIVTVIVTTDSDISPENAKRAAKYLAYATMAVHGASKLWGVKIDEDEFKKTS